MDYEQLEDHIQSMCMSHIYRQIKELKQMDVDELPGFRLKIGANYPQRLSLNINSVDRQSSKAEMTLTHIARNDRNRQGKELRHLLCHERPQNLYTINTSQ